MAAKPAPRLGWEAFARPAQVSQRRYEAIRAYVLEGAPLGEAAARFGYTRSALASLVRDFRAGKLALFAEPGRPGRKSAPRKDAARGRVIELRRAGLSVYEISARLAAEGTPLNRTGVGQILAEEGFGRLLRHPEPEASISPATAGRATNLPPAKVIDFAAFPAAASTRLAGLLLAVPDLVALDLPALARKAGYPGTRVIPAASWLLSLLALKLTATRRVSHVDDLLDDPASALFAGLAILPKKSALTNYSYRLSHDHQRKFLAALDEKMIAAGLAGSDEGIFDLDFHAVMHWGNDPALEKHYVPTRSQRARSVLTFFAQDTGTHNLVYANADISKATQNREVIAFCDHWKAASGKDPKMLVMDQKVTNQAVLGELDARGVKFLTLRMRSAALIRHINGLTSKDYKTVALDRPGPHNKPRVHEDNAVKLTSYPGTVRQLVVTGLGRDPPTVIITNEPGHPQEPDQPVRPADDHRAAPRRDHPLLLRRRPVLHRQPQRRPRHRALRPGPGPPRRVPHPARRRLRHRHPRHPPAALPRQLRNHQHQRRQVTVRIDRRAYSPVLRQASLPADTTVPWWHGRRLHFEFS